MKKITDINSDYEPSEEEEYMNDKHLEYFRQLLIKWKNELLNDSRGTLDHLKETSLNQPDINDQAANALEANITVRRSNRKLKLMAKVNDALDRIKNREYGYCEKTGEPIGLARLKARPIATLCIEAQEHHERYEKQHNEDSNDDGSDDQQLFELY